MTAPSRNVRFTPESGHGLPSVQNPFCVVLVGWHRRRFGYCWKQRTRGRCNGNNCGGANHAAQKSATIYGFHDFPPVPPHPSSSTRKFDASSPEEWRGAQHRARRSVEGLTRDQRR